MSKKKSDHLRMTVSCLFFLLFPDPDSYPLISLFINTFSPSSHYLSSRHAHNLIFKPFINSI